MAYRDFVDASDLQARILVLAQPEVVEGVVSFEKAANRIRQLFDEHDLESGISSEIGAAYDALGDRPAVAVRSSATAEDSPEVSFAGQHETYLNGRGPDAVAAAAKDCWASLWTARAMRYRHERSMEHDTAAMAVVVQTMVPSEVSGIVFTANPASGERAEMIVNCSLGLGETVVGGQVTPDTYVVDRDSLTVKETVIGSKERMIVADGEQGTRTQDVSQEGRQGACLSNAALSDLAALAIAVEDAFDGEPQDIEWALRAGKLWLLQSRPITKLPPEPPKDVTWPEVPGAQLLKRQVAENMPDPLSAVIRRSVSADYFRHPDMAERMGMEGSAHQELDEELRCDHGQRLRLSAYLQGAIRGLGRTSGEGPRRAARAAMACESQTCDQDAELHDRGIEGRTAARDVFVDDGVSHFQKVSVHRDLGKAATARLPGRRRVLTRRDTARATNAELLLGMKSLTTAEAQYWHALRSVIGTAKITDGGFQRFLEENTRDEGFISGTFLSGFSSRTLDAEFVMRAIADGIREDPSLYELAVVTPAPRLLDAIGRHPRGAPVGAAIDKYLHDYGRQVFNLDFVEPSLTEEPLPFAKRLQALVRDVGYDLPTRQRRVAKTRRRKLLQALKFFKGRQRFEFLRLYWTARVNYPSREEALFYMGAPGRSSAPGRWNWGGAWWTSVRLAARMTCSTSPAPSCRRPSTTQRCRK